MRFVLVAFCALALAYPASAQTVNWKVDTHAYATRTIPDSVETMRTTTYDYGTATLGRVRLAPTFRLLPREDSPVFAPTGQEDMELGLNGYLKSHPRLMLIGKYLYRRAHKDEERELQFERMGHLPDVSHGDRFSIGISCKFPLTDCFTH